MKHLSILSMYNVLPQTNNPNTTICRQAARFIPSQKQMWHFRKNTSPDLLSLVPNISDDHSIKTPNKLSFCLHYFCILEMCPLYGRQESCAQFRSRYVTLGGLGSINDCLPNRYELGLRPCVAAAVASLSAKLKNVLFAI